MAVIIETEVEIARPSQQVFEYVTTPALWHTWHPATVEVRDVPDRPLTTGETMLELIAVGSRRDKALWTVRACEPPARWEIATDTPNGSADIVYRIAPTAAGAASIARCASAPSAGPGACSIRRSRAG